MPSQSIALSFRNYIWLADTIYSAGHITREEINRKWRNNSLINPDGTPEIAERTFHKWRHAIEDLFNINIECDRSLGGAYYIDHAEDMEQGGMRDWLINTFATNNLIHESRQIKHHILFEQIPSGQRFLTPLIEAIRDKKRVSIHYRSFRSSEAHDIIVSPYCVKIFNRRWYLLGKSDTHREPHIYALDRFEEIHITYELYRLPVHFDAEAYFADRYGVSKTQKDKPERVRLRVKAQQVPYLRTLPIHSSQREVETETDASVFELFLIPNYELKQELHKYMSDIEVLRPRWLREEMALEIEETMKIYNK